MHFYAVTAKTMPKGDWPMTVTFAPAVCACLA